MPQTPMLGLLRVNAVTPQEFMDNAGLVGMCYGHGDTARHEANARLVVRSVNLTPKTRALLQKIVGHRKCAGQQAPADCLAEIIEDAYALLHEMQECGL